MLVSLAWKAASFICAKHSSKAGSDSHCWWHIRTSMAALLTLALSLCNSLSLCLSVGHLAALLAWFADPTYNSKTSLSSSSRRDIHFNGWHKGKWCHFHKQTNKLSKLTTLTNSVRLPTYTSAKTMNSYGCAGILLMLYITVIKLELWWTAPSRTPEPHTECTTTERSLWHTIATSRKVSSSVDCTCESAQCTCRHNLKRCRVMEVDKTLFVGSCKIAQA